jgi:hypothetical protein
MNHGKFVFSQIISFLPKRAFDWQVMKFDGDRYVKHFTCWNQLLCMMYGQLCTRDSLSDLIVCIRAHKAKYYHLGFGKNVSKNNLSHSNKNRNYRIYENFANHLVGVAQSNCPSDDDPIEDIDGPVYAVDSSVIDLCLNVFWWAEFRKNKGGIKMHTLFDVKTNIPTFIYVSEALLHDVHFLDMINFEIGSYYVFDKAYIDFHRLYRITLAGSTFVTRMKRNAKFEIVSRAKIRKSKGIRSDHTIILSNYYASKEYPEKLRKIRFYDDRKKKLLIFLTNNFELKAEEIAMLYKHRWRIENYFKWIKQHLKIKSFWGETPNAVRTQIYIAMISYLLVAIIRTKMNSKYTNYEVLQIIGSSLLDKTPLRDLLEKPISIQDFKEQNANQLKISFG